MPETKTFEFLLDKLISWPVITLVAILLFRKPVIGLLGRVHTVAFGGLGLDFKAATAASIQSESKAGETGLDEDVKKRLQEVENFGVSPVVSQRVQLIQADIQKLHLDVNQKTVDLLVKHLARTQFLLSLESTYRMIWGSQIVLLRQLNTFGVRTRAELSPIYESAIAHFPQVYDHYSFEQWLQFLRTQGLIATQDEEHFDITDFGKEFLMWMTNARVLENKPF